MTLEQHLEKTINKDAQSVYQAALAAVEYLKGAQDAGKPAPGRLAVMFPKVILGKTLGERTHLDFQVQAQGDGSLVVLDAYPLDAIGRKLMFGARKGVTQAVVDLFVEALEERCK